MDAVQGVEHIRKELILLCRLARGLRLKELAHFIDVAGEVATELRVTEAGKQNGQNHA